MIAVWCGVLRNEDRRPVVLLEFEGPWEAKTFVQGAGVRGLGIQLAADRLPGMPNRKYLEDHDLPMRRDDGEDGVGPVLVYLLPKDPRIAYLTERHMQAIEEWVQERNISVRSEDTFRAMLKMNDTGEDLRLELVEMVAAWPSPSVRIVKR